MRYQRGNRRFRLMAPAGLLLAALLLLNACSSAAPAPTPMVPTPTKVPEAPAGVRVPGRFVYGQTNFLWTLAHRGEAKQLVQGALPAGSFPTSPAASPDGQQVAFSLYVPSPDLRVLGGTDLYVVDRDGGNLRRVVQHDTPSSAFEDPAWSPDGRSILVTYRAPVYQDSRYVGDVRRLERTSVEGGKRAIVLNEASQGSYLPDGKSIVYVVTDGQTAAQSLWTASADGRQPRALVEPGRFINIFAPRPAPDGKVIVFGALTVKPTTPGGTGSTDTPSRGFPLASWLAPAVAEAHGVPWELWRIQPDGSGLQQIVPAVDGTPYALWLPGGQDLAWLDEQGIYLLKPPEHQAMRLADLTGGLGLTWLPE